MEQSNWQVRQSTGFLIQPEPLLQLHAEDNPLMSVMEKVEGVAFELPHLIGNGQLSQRLEQLPLLDTYFLQQDDIDFVVIERLFKLYGYFASAYVLASLDESDRRLPVSVALPLVDLAEIVQRPPMLSYAGLVLNNWRKIDLFGGLDVDNIAILQTFTDLPDEQWFFIIHVAIEARSGEIMHHLQQSHEAAQREDDQAFMDALHQVMMGLVDVTRIFNRMPEQCDPDVYFQKVRPYLFGFTDVIYEGIVQYNGKPQSFRGGSGAQSSMIPAIIAGLGIEHSRSGLTEHLESMKAYMPPHHRQFIDRMKQLQIREYARQKGHFIDAYNHCLKRLITFRRAHFHYARTYIFEKSMNPTGTGGTPFMEWLNLLIQETQSHFL